mmetsp:Transcript_7806/g.24357  ORF Transcript_7806/g.24357 Transcript_7806/m.24357 type:complete len:203 (+) Transcript_7806:1339-1947(+)
MCHRALHLEAAGCRTGHTAMVVSPSNRRHPGLRHQDVGGKTAASLDAAACHPCGNLPSSGGQGCRRACHRLGGHTCPSVAEHTCFAQTPPAAILQTGRRRRPVDIRSPAYRGRRPSTSGDTVVPVCWSGSHAHQTCRGLDIDCHCGQRRGRMRVASPAPPVVLLARGSQGRELRACLPVRTRMRRGRTCPYDQCDRCGGRTS